MDPNTPSVKPAWLTTEFWITVIPTVIVLIKLITGKDVQGVDITGLATLAVGIMTAAYGISRALQKKAVIQAKANITQQKLAIAHDVDTNSEARRHETAMQTTRFAPQVGAKELDMLASRVEQLEARLPAAPRRVAKKTTPRR